MIGRQHGDDWKRRQLSHVEITRGEAALLADDGDIDFAMAQSGNLLAGRKVEELHLHVRVRLAE